MSSWVDNQRQEAFAVWRTYLAMGLHFREGSSYDYGLYGGATSATPASFARRPKTEVAKFIKLNNRLRFIGAKADEFLFANARQDITFIDELLRDDAVQVYKDWKSAWGTPKDFGDSVKTLLRTVVKPDSDEVTSIPALILKLIDKPDPKAWYEVIVYLLESYPDAERKVSEQIEDNELYKIHLARAIRFQKIYSYLGII